MGPRVEHGVRLLLDDQPCKLRDEVNRSLNGPLFLEDQKYHTDLDEKGNVILKHSSISKINFGSRA